MKKQYKKGFFDVICFCQLGVPYICAVAFLFMLTACMGSKREYSCIAPPFVIPPDITTIEGEDPYAEIHAKPVADIYWDNTQSQIGYAQNKNNEMEESAEFATFFRIVTNLAVGPNYKPQYWALRVEPKSKLNKSILHWTHVSALTPGRKNFYTFEGSLLNRERGPLTMLYDTGLIDPKHLSIIVTDMEEQGLNVTLLADLIRHQLLRFDDYVVAVIATKLPFNGINKRPDPSKLEGTVSKKYNGLKPIYSVVFGRRDAVRGFLKRFEIQTKNLKFSARWYVATTIQKGERKLLDIFNDIDIPKSADRDEVNVQTRKKGIVPYFTRPEKYEDGLGVKRIWNLQEKTDSIVDHFYLLVDDQVKQIREKLYLRIFEYNKVTPSWKDGNWLWSLNIGFDLPKDLLMENLECEIKNYRYLTKTGKKTESDLKETEGQRENTKSKETSAENEYSFQWKRNDLFANKDLNIYLFQISNENKGIVCIAPKDKNGELESSVICFDLIVKVQQKIEIPKWVDDFNDVDFSDLSLNQDKTLNFKGFVASLLQDETKEDVQCISDEFIRLPIMLFNMPFRLSN